MVRFRPFKQAVERLAFAGGTELIAGWRDQWGKGSVVWWDWQAGKARHRIAAPDVGISPGGGFVAVHQLDGGQVRVYRGRGRKPVAVIEVGEESHWVSPAVAPDGSELLAICGNEVVFFRLPDGAELARRPRADAWSAGYSPGERWAFVTAERWVRVWYRYLNRKVFRLPSGRFPVFAVGGDDRTAAATARGQNEAITVWDLVTRRAVGTLPHRGEWIASAAVSPDGRRVLTGTTTGATRLWDAATGKLVREYAWGIEAVTGLAFAADGLTCAAGGGTGEVVVWDLDD